MYPVGLHAFGFMSNHWHGLVTVANAFQLARFTQRLHSMIGLAVHDLVGWEGRVLKPASPVVVAADREDARLKYVLSQGTKEGLVRSPLEWPGLNSARALCGKEELVGEWFDRTLANRLGFTTGRRKMSAEDERKLWQRYPITLTPLPSWQGLTTQQMLERANALIREIESDAVAQHARPLGPSRVIAQNPLHCAEKLMRRRRVPVIHTNRRDVRDAYCEQRNAVGNEYRTASHRLRRGGQSVVPASCFPPVAAFSTERVQIVARAVSAGATPDSDDEEG